MSEQPRARRQDRRSKRKKRRTGRRIAASNLMNRFLRNTLGPWLLHRYNVTGENTEIFHTLRRPFLVLPNHTSVWDPFMVNAFVPGPIHYVVSDAQFRSRLMEWGLGLVGSIPKTKVMSDLDAVKNIMKVKDHGGIIGIFPEGQNTWDGHTLPIYSSTAKLVKLLRIPVVTARIAGAFLSRPRWGRLRRRGAVNIRFNLAYTPDQLKKTSAEEIARTIAEHLEHDEYVYNREHGVLFRGSALAEYVERAVFACAQCGALGTLRSDGDLVVCSACGASLRYCEDGLFAAENGETRFDNLHEWNLWQTEHLQTRLTRYVTEDDPPALFREDEVAVEIGYKANPLEPYRQAAIELYGDRLELISESHGRESMAIDRIRGVNVQNNERLEFYHNDDLFRLTPADPRTNMYKWDLALRQIQSIRNAETTPDA